MSIRTSLHQEGMMKTAVWPGVTYPLPENGQRSLSMTTEDGSSRMVGNNANRFSLQLQCPLLLIMHFVPSKEMMQAEHLTIKQEQSTTNAESSFLIAYVRKG